MIIGVNSSLILTVRNKIYIKQWDRGGYILLNNNWKSTAIGWWSFWRGKRGRLPSYYTSSFIILSTIYIIIDYTKYEIKKKTTHIHNLTSSDNTRNNTIIIHVYNCTHTVVNTNVFVWNLRLKIIFVYKKKLVGNSTHIIYTYIIFF